MASESTLPDFANKSQRSHLITVVVTPPSFEYALHGSLVG